MLQFFESLFADYSAYTLVAVTLLAFIAGFIDSMVGGGGLIQLPALLIHLPQTPLPVLFGTNKIASLAGTSVAAFRYARRIKFNFRLLFVVSFFAFVGSGLGAKMLTYLSADKLKPLVLVILIVIAIYTFIKKDLGSFQTKSLPFRKQLIYGGLIGFVVGFYDGFFGPGTGSFFVLFFVVVLGFEFVAASAYSKIVNSMTNVSALMVFVSQGQFIGGIAVLMAFANVAGSISGSGLALKKGNGFVRIIFLVVVSIMILRYGYDVIQAE